jgi:CBS domain containing-hemolysin-like protein
MLFTSSEASIFSLSRLDIASLRSFGLKEKYLNMIKNPDELLIVLIAGNEIVDYFASFCFSNGFELLLKEWGKEIAFLIFAIIGFWLGDFLPKVAGFKLRIRLISKIIFFTYFFYNLFLPFRKVFSFFYKRLPGIFPVKKKETESLSPVEQIIIHTLEIAHREDKISEKEKEFIYGLFLSEKIPVSAIMTPRSEIVAFKDQLITIEFLSKLRLMPYNKFPVYKESLDDVIGILYAKDLIKNFSSKILNKKKLSDFVRPVIFIPETFKVRELLFEFQKKQTKIALVVDEYGTLKGLVTLEDILEELFGEIYEEREAKIKPVQKKGKNYWLVHGKVLLEEVKNILEIEISEEELSDIKTLNGFLLALFKELPKEGDTVHYQGYEFTIKKIKGRKIIWVEIKKLNEMQKDEEVKE